MAEPPRKGSAEPEDRQDVLGKLDQLLQKHRPNPAHAEPSEVPVLTDALPEAPAPARDSIPTLTDVVGAPPASPVPAPVRVPPSDLEARLIVALVAAIETERDRLRRGDAVEPDRAHLLDALILQLTRATPALVHAALADARPHDPATPERAPP